METDNVSQNIGCGECLEKELDFDFTMAFQPIVNTTTQEIFAYEALARGVNNEPAGEVFKRVNDANRYRFDQSCRTKAIQLAAALEMPTCLSINFLPNAVYRPERCIQTTLVAAELYGFPIERIIFEITESEKVEDLVHLREIVEYYRARGFKTAIDDFGAGYAGLNFLSEIQTDIIKLDMALIRNIDQNPVRLAIVKGVLQVCEELSSTVIAEGIETVAELKTLQDLGIELFQGFYFAKPAFQSLSSIDWHELNKN
jgi:EAL domain-containing protein (putative c-di-GMP-specific phosphodiesterase class I)